MVKFGLEWQIFAQAAPVSRQSDVERKNVESVDGSDWFRRSVQRVEHWIERRPQRHHRPRYNRCRLYRLRNAGTTTHAGQLFIYTMPPPKHEIHIILYILYSCKSIAMKFIMRYLDDLSY